MQVIVIHTIILAAWAAFVYASIHEPMITLALIITGLWMYSTYKLAYQYLDLIRGK